MNEDLTRMWLQIGFIFLTIKTVSGSVTPYCTADESNNVWKCNYIPEDIPNGWRRVYVEMSHFNIACTDTCFRSKNWQRVETFKIIYPDDNANLQLYHGCFKNLRHLKYLGINVANYFSVFPGSLQGTNSIKSLNMSGSRRLHWTEFMQALNETDVLPHLEEFYLDRVSIVIDTVNLDKAVFDLACFRNLIKLSFSGMQISNINATALMNSMPQLKFLNVSNVNLNDAHFEVHPNFYGRIESADFCDMQVPKFMASGDFVVYNVKVVFKGLNDKFRFLLDIGILNISGIMGHAKIEIHNCELILNRLIHTRTKTLIAKRNNIKFLDVKVSGDSKYGCSSLQNIDISQNSMEFLQPDVLAFFSNLKFLRAAENSLSFMLKTNSNMFETLFYNNPKLRLVDLSSNGLDSVPSRQFIENNDLEVIILSNNKIQDVHFVTDNLVRLRTLDLRNNMISYLDSASLNNLDKLSTKIPTTTRIVLEIDHNPLLCSNCNSKPFITWLTHTRYVNLSMSRLQCTAEHGRLEYINESIVHDLKLICERTTILGACLSALGLLLVVGATVTACRIRRWKIHRKQLKRDQLLDNIRQGEGQYEFVVMVSYNSEEEEFIRRYVLEQLNSNLQLLVGTERDLILTGDQHFRPGFMLHNEIAACLERVSLVISLITESYCTSGFCLSELDQAWIQRKPMMLMFKDDVEEELMTPLMKNIYRTNVRILWTEEDGEYVLKTTWENVCKSILEVITATQYKYK